MNRCITYHRQSLGLTLKMTELLLLSSPERVQVQQWFRSLLYTMQLVDLHVKLGIHVYSCVHLNDLI